MGGRKSGKLRYKLRLNGCQLRNTKSRVLAASGHVLSSGEKISRKTSGIKVITSPYVECKVQYTPAQTRTLFSILHR